MELDTLALAVALIARILIWIVIGSVLVSYFLSPYHPVRETLDRIT
jgi:hypothetical protein